MYTTLLVFSALLTHNAAGACLSAAELTSLGFASSQPKTKLSDPSVCTSLFEKEGACVPESSVRAKFEADAANFQIATASVVGMIDTLSILATTIGSVDSQYSSAISKLSSDLKATKDSCFEAWGVVTRGTTCYLASGSASDYISWAGDDLTISVERSSVGAYLYACVNFIDAVCFLSSGFSISSDLSLNDDAFLSSVGRYQPGCKRLKDDFACIGDKDCRERAYDTIIEVFYKPYDFSFFPSTGVLAAIRQKLSDVASDVFKWFSAVYGGIFERKLGARCDVSTKSSANGARVKEYGSNSAVAAANSFAGLARWAAVGVAVLIVTNWA